MVLLIITHLQWEFVVTTMVIFFSEGPLDPIDLLSVLGSFLFWWHIEKSVTQVVLKKHTNPNWLKKKWSLFLVAFYNPSTSDSRVNISRDVNLWKVSHANENLWFILEDNIFFSKKIHLFGFTSFIYAERRDKSASFIYAEWRDKSASFIYAEWRDKATEITFYLTVSTVRYSLGKCAISSGREHIKTLNKSNFTLQWYKLFNINESNKLITKWTHLKKFQSHKTRPTSSIPTKWNLKCYLILVHYSYTPCNKFLISCWRHLLFSSFWYFYTFFKKFQTFLSWT